MTLSGDFNSFIKYNNVVTNTIEKYWDNNLGVTQVFFPLYQQLLDSTREGQMNRQN